MRHSNSINSKLFEEYLILINQELLKRKPRWNLKILSWMDFEDVSQIVRFHIYKKIHLYDPKKPILPWLNRLISNQIKNLIRNYYGNFSRPCLKCAASQGGSDCAIYVKQCSDCPLYKKWEKTKKNAHDARLPVSIENHTHEINQKSGSEVRVESFLVKLKKEAVNFLKPIEYKVFVSLYIEHNSEKETSLLLGYSDKEQRAGIKNIKLISKSLISKIKNNLYAGNIDY